jgi:hypothetical protein
MNRRSIGHLPHHRTGRDGNASPRKSARLIAEGAAMPMTGNKDDGYGGTHEVTGGD